MTLEEIDIFDDLERQPISVIPADGWRFSYAYPNVEEGVAVTGSVGVIAWASLAGTQYLEPMISIDGCPPSIPTQAWAGTLPGFVGCVMPGSPFSLHFDDAAVLLRQIISREDPGPWTSTVIDDLTALARRADAG